MTEYALTKPQQRIYTLEQFADGSTGVATCGLWRGELNLAAMQNAIRLLVKNNDALRLQITAEGKQRFLPYTEPAMPQKQFPDEAALHAWAKKEAKQPFDIHGTLYRFVIVTAGDIFGLFVHFHHSVADGWGALRFASLLHQYYQNPVDEMGPSYLTYIQKEERYLQSARAGRDRDFWLAQFPTTPVPCFLGKAQASSMEALRWDVAIPAKQVQPFLDFAQQHQLSVYTIWMTALAIYLSRVRGQTDFCIGTTTLGRADSVSKQTIGMFAGTMPIPVHINPQAGFAQNAKDLRDSAFAAMRHEGFGLQDVQAALKERDGFDGRLYDVLLNYQNATVFGMDESFVGTWWYHCGVQPESLQIQITDRDNAGELWLSYDYQTELFTLAEIQRLHKRLMALLQDMFTNPDKPAEQLQLLCEEDEALYNTINQTEQLLSLRAVHTFFEEHAARQPQAPAVIYGDKTLTYQELDDWAQRIAAYLHSRQIQPGEVVALYMERCLELMPLLLGILKAGCAYLPISPAWPAQRVDYVLSNAQAALVVFEPALALTDTCCPAIDTTRLHNLPQGDATSSTDASLTAYVMYTSGSTGNPKGVRIGHDALCNRLLWMQDAYPLAEDEILIQKTNYAFDVSAWELFWALMQGKTLLVPEPDAHKDPRRLAELIVQHGIQTIHFVPSMLSLFLDELQRSGKALPSLQRVIVSGEALTPALNRRFYTVFAGTQTRLINLYGPTECTVDVLYYDCAAEDAEIPIGLPVWNTGALILDERDALLPPGETGELCITGIQLAKGYVDPALDVGRFVEHPIFGRLYKTGDQCSVREDGNILYHGRNDGQVKVRGQRVELAEIERQLEGLAGISRAAVHFDGTHLVAFYEAAAQLDAAQMRTQLEKQLPVYMLPDSLHRVESFVLNANGKLDRKHLAQLAAELPAPTANKAAAEPATQQERLLLAAVWAQLGNKTVGVEDSPSRCGLSSLEIVSVTLELEKQGMHLRARDFYVASDFRALALLATQDTERPLFVTFSNKQAEGAEIACVGVPYGGGSFGAWADIAQVLPMPLLALQHAHGDPQETLQALLQQPYQKYVVVGCCVGSGNAIALAERLEKAGRLSALCIAASVPPAGVSLFGNWFNPWYLRGAKKTNQELQRLSEKEMRLGAPEIQQLRDDASWFLRYLANNRHSSLQAPVRLIYGSNDPMLRGADLKQRWERFFGKEVSVQILPGAKHDILHTHPAEVAQVIAQK